jgi:hypothetical protein
MGFMSVVGGQMLQSRQQRRGRSSAMPAQCLSARGMQTIQCVRIELLGSPIQNRGEVVEF